MGQHTQEVKRTAQCISGIYAGKWGSMMYRALYIMSILYITKLDQNLKK